MPHPQHSFSCALSWSCQSSHERAEVLSRSPLLIGLDVGKGTHGKPTPAIQQQHQLCEHSWFSLSNDHPTSPGAFLVWRRTTKTVTNNQLKHQSILKAVSRRHPNVYATKCQPLESWQVVMVDNQRHQKTLDASHCDKRCSLNVEWKHNVKTNVLEHGLRSEALIAIAIGWPSRWLIQESTFMSTASLLPS